MRHSTIKFSCPDLIAVEIAEAIDREVETSDIQEPRGDSIEYKYLLEMANTLFEGHERVKTWQRVDVQFRMPSMLVSGVAFLLNEIYQRYRFVTPYSDTTHFLSQLSDLFNAERVVIRNKESGK